MTGTWLTVLSQEPPSSWPGMTPSPAPAPVPSPSPGVYLAAPGLSIGQLLSILLPLIVCAIVVLTWREQQQKKRAGEVSSAVESLAGVLGERLETKENVALVRIEVARLKAEIATLREVIRELNRTVEQLKNQRGRLP